MLKTFVNMNLFDYLKQGFKSIEQIRSFHGLKIPARNLFDLFNLLVGLGMLERQGFEETAAYRNTKSTNELFLKESPKNMLSLFTLLMETIKSFQNLQKILKVGLPKNE